MSRIDAATAMFKGAAYAAAYMLCLVGFFTVMGWALSFAHGFCR